MKKEKELLYVSVFLAIIAGFISLIYDKIIILFISDLRGVYLDYFLLSIAFSANVFIVLFFLMTIFLWSKNQKENTKKRWVIPLILSTIFSFLMSFILKIAFKRPRPFVALASYGFKALTVAFYFIKDNHKTWNFSFPSFEALFIFSTIPFFCKEFKGLGWIWVLFAIFASFSRVYFGVHYLSDVIFGALIGYLIGYLFIKIEEKHKIGLKIMNFLN